MTPTIQCTTSGCGSQARTTRAIGSQHHPSNTSGTAPWIHNRRTGGAAPATSFARSKLLGSPTIVRPWISTARTLVRSPCHLDGGWRPSPRMQIAPQPELRGGVPSGAEGNRTPGLNSAIVALYQLSYSPGRPSECSGATGIRRRADQRSTERRRAVLWRRTGPVCQSCGAAAASCDGAGSLAGSRSIGGASRTGRGRRSGVGGRLAGPQLALQVALAQLAEQADVAEQAHDGDHGDPHHRRRLGGGGEEQRARRRSGRGTNSTLARRRFTASRPVGRDAAGRAAWLRTRGRGVIESGTGSGRLLTVQAHGAVGPGRRQRAAVRAAAARSPGPAGGSRAAERRLGQRTAHRAHRHAARRHRPLQAGELGAEVRHRRVRTVLDP